MVEDLDNHDENNKIDSSNSTSGNEQRAEDVLEGEQGKDSSSSTTVREDEKRNRLYGYAAALISAAR